MVDIPKKLKIGGLEFKVVRVPAPLCENEVVAGTIDRGLGIIEIKESIYDDMAWVVLLHEIMHGIDVREDLDEETIWTIAHGIYQVFKDNGLMQA